MGRKLRAMNFLGQSTYLAGKPKGEISMSVKQVSTKVCSVVRPASPVRMAKPGLVEPKFPVVYEPTYRSIPGTVTTQNCGESNNAIISRWKPRLRNALCDERPAMSRLKGMSWEPKRTKRLTSVNAGSPKGCES